MTKQPKEKDIRSTPLDKCVSFGDLMYTIEKCKELDKKDKKKKQTKPA